MNNSKFSEFKKSIKAFYNNSYDQYNGEEITISSNNVVLQSALESFDDLCVYHNTVSSGAILNDFKDQYGDQLLKDSSVKKLINWLKEESIIFLFEHDLVINKGVDYYMSKQAFLMYKNDEPEEDLNHWLNGDKLTDNQKSIIESELSSYIDDEQNTLFIHAVSFEFTLPKRAILKAYAEYVRGNR